MTFNTLALAAALIVSPAPLSAQKPGQIHERKTDQQQRIAQGVRSGQLTRGETRHLETQQRGINHEERAMRAQDNGHLTKADKRLVSHQQNQESKRIHRAKHNSRTR